MYKIDSDGATGDNRFTDGDETLGTPATVLPADYLNMLQDEIMAVLTAAGISPSKANNAQLLASLDKRYGRFASGDRLVFPQASAPTGWTKVTGLAGRGLRLVDGAGGGVGGSSDAFAAHSHTVGAHSHGDSFAVASHTLTTTQMPSHRHSALNGSSLGSVTGTWYYGEKASSSNQSANYTQYTGGGSSHTHGLTGAVSNSSSFSSGSFTPRYINSIVCAKD